MKPHALSIWFLIGLQFSIFGVLILGSGIYEFNDLVSTQLASYHAAIWWGCLMLAVGLFYSIKFRPNRTTKP